jgi:hypothetical protein
MMERLVLGITIAVCAPFVIWVTSIKQERYDNDKLLRCMEQRDRPGATFAELRKECGNAL